MLPRAVAELLVGGLAGGETNCPLARVAAESQDMAEGRSILCLVRRWRTLGDVGVVRNARSCECARMRPIEAIEPSGASQRGKARAKPSPYKNTERCDSISGGKGHVRCGVAGLWEAGCVAGSFSLSMVCEREMGGEGAALLKKSAAAAGAQQVVAAPQPEPGETVGRLSPLARGECQWARERHEVPGRYDGCGGRPAPRQVLVRSSTERVVWMRLAGTGADTVGGAPGDFFFSGAQQLQVLAYRRYHGS